MSEIEHFFLCLRCIFLFLFASSPLFYSWWMINNVLLRRSRMFWGHILIILKLISGACAFLVLLPGLEYSAVWVMSKHESHRQKVGNASLSWRNSQAKMQRFAGPWLVGNEPCLYDKTAGYMRSKIHWYLPIFIDIQSMSLRNRKSVLQYISNLNANFLNWLLLWVICPLLAWIGQVEKCTLMSYYEQDMGEGRKSFDNLFWSPYMPLIEGGRNLWALFRRIEVKTFYELDFLI